MSRIRDGLLAGKSERAMARELGLSRNTVSKYKAGMPERTERRRRGSILDPYKEQIMGWVTEDRLLNCEVMLMRLRAQGYAGGLSTIKTFVQPLRPQPVSKRPVMRYETPPGHQLQFDWGECVYDDGGTSRKVFALVAILGHSRMRYVEFVSRCDSPTLLRGLIHAFTFFGGVPERVLTDRMKTVLLRMEDKAPVWHPLFLELMTMLGIVPSVCRAYTPQTKGKVERTVDVVKESFWPGVRFTDLDDLNRQARIWMDHCNARVHRTTRQVPRDLLPAEGLRPLAPRSALTRFLREERRVSRDGFFSFDGVEYGVPASAGVAGTTVQVEGDGQELALWSRGVCVVRLPRHGAGIHLHPEQWTDVPTAVALRHRQPGLGHKVSEPGVGQRPLTTYDQLYQVAAPTAVTA